jgi:hypothetical protein
MTDQDLQDILLNPTTAGIIKSAQLISGDALTILARVELDRRIRADTAREIKASTQGPYTVTIPDLDDFVRLPRTHQQDLIYKRDLIRRLKETKSPVPEPLKWLIPVITQIDNCQDIAITAYPIVKFIAKKYAPKAVPYLGWGLLAMDAANLANAALSFPLGGRMPKRALFSGAREASHLTASLRYGVPPYLRSVNAVAYWLQAAQAAQSITGYGLVLGQGMGTLSDGTWGAIKAATGQDVVIKLPHPSSLTEKSEMVLMGQAELLYGTAGLTKDEIIKIAFGNMVASLVIMEYESNKRFENRVPELFPNIYPAQETWNAITREALSLEGINPDGPPTHNLPPSIRKHTFEDTMTIAASKELTWEKEILEKVPESDTRTAVIQSLRTANSAIWDFINKKPDSMTFVPGAEFKIMAKAVEYGVFPVRDKWTPPKEQIDEFLVKAKVKFKGLLGTLKERQDFLKWAGEYSNSPKLNMTAARAYLKLFPTPYRAEDLADMNRYTLIKYKSFRIDEPGRPYPSQIKKWITRVEKKMLSTVSTVPTKTQLEDATIEAGFIWWPPPTKYLTE